MRRREKFIYLVLFLVTAAVYWPAGHFKFLDFDDWAYVWENAFVRQGLTAMSVTWAWKATLLGNWHPVTWMSHMLDCDLFGVRAGAHHLVNVFFHTANTLLLFHWLRRLTGRLWPSAMVAALFAWHPVHVESVAWISERKDVLSTFFGLLSLIAYTRYAQGGRRSRVEGRQERTLTPSLSHPMGEGNLNIQQPTSDVQPPTVKSGELGTGRPHPTPSTLDSRLSSFDYLLSLVFFALGLMSKPMLVTWPFVFLLLDFWPLHRLRFPGIQIQEDTLTPRHRSTIPRLVIEKIPFFALSIGASAMTLLTQRMAGAMPDRDILTFSHSVDNALVSYARYLGKLFWPSNLSAMYPYQLALPDWSIIGSVMILALITVLAVWQRSSRPYLLMGWLWFVGTLVPVSGLVQVGSQAMADRYLYIPAIGIFLMLAWGASDLLKRWPAAKVVGGLAGAAALIACVVLTGMQLRYWQDSVTLFRHALAVTGDNMMAEYALGDSLAREDKPDEGLYHLERALQLKPDLGEAIIKVADLWSRQGRTREAIEEYRLGLNYRSKNINAINNLAWLLATAEDPGLRQPAEAVQLAKRACDLFEMPGNLDTLAAAYAGVGQYSDAIRTGERARALALLSGGKQHAARIRQRIELYRSGQAYYEGTPKK
ncbi:MAG TPA: hypothetical protein VFD66_01280 [Verrucomicrobiae bacterium]|nr:hypothetical protein [Verrucomicrobiae bacterium]